MLKGLILAASTTALIATSYIGVSVVTSSSATAQRGFGCQINASRCDNQLNTPRTFASDRKKSPPKASARKKGKRR